MRKVFLSGLVLILLIACGKTEQKYTQESAEIDTVKQLIANYDNQSYDMSLYADTSKTYYNSKDNALSKDEVLAYHQGNDAIYSSRSFMAEDQHYEMVITDEGDTWVNCWLNWEGTLKGNGQTYQLPIHLTYQFLDGKIVREIGMWDRTEIAMAQMAIEAAKEMSVEEKAINATINDVVSAWNANDTAKMAAALTSDFVRTENGETTITSAQAYGEEVMGSNFTAYPDFKVKLNSSTVSGNQAMINWTVTGTNTGEFNGNPPTGKPVEVHGMSVWTFNEDGKATREDAYYDRMAMMSQMGYTVAPPQ